MKSSASELGLSHPAHELKFALKSLNLTTAPVSCSTTMGTSGKKTYIQCVTTGKLKHVKQNELHIRKIQAISFLQTITEEILSR